LLRDCEQLGHSLPETPAFKDGRIIITMVSRGRIKQSRNQNRILLPFFAAIKPPAIPEIS
jgi:hypothetical protein